MKKEYVKAEIALYNVNSNVTMVTTSGEGGDGSKEAKSIFGTDFDNLEEE